MNIEDTPTNLRPRLSRRWQLRALLAVSLIWLAPTLACGSFAERPTPTPTPLTVTGEATVAPTGPSGGPVTLSTPILPVLTDTPTPEPTATFTPTPIPGTALAVGQPARVVAPNGVNMRGEPSPDAALIRYLPSRLRVTIVEGPVDAAGFRWWKLDDGEGNVGWAIETTAKPTRSAHSWANQSQWIVPTRVGERVRVTMSSGGQLSVRETPGTDATIVVRIDPGGEFTVTGGPQEASGYTWFQIRSDSGDVEGWAAESDGTERWLSPLE
jgi:SH3-like domain-containing protein